MQPAKTVKVGLFLTNQHRPGVDLVAAMDDQLRLVRAVRDAGWDSLWAGQHYLPDGMAMLQCVPFLARAAAEAGDMEIGAGILLLALHNPLDVAETWATMDVVCRGRLTFGVGLGYRETEYAGFGLDPSSKVRRFEANLELVQRLWSGEEVDADLPWCRLRGARLGVLPVQRPRPPVWIAANADKAVERAARLADAWLINPHATTTTIRGQLDLYHASRPSAGLAAPTSVPALREIYCAPTRAEAMRLAGPYLSKKYEAYADWGQDKALPGEESFRIPFDDLEQGRFIIGSPEQCLEQLLPWRDEMGVDHFVLRTDWIGMPAEVALQSIDLLSREVIPVLRSKAVA